MLYRLEPASGDLVLFAGTSPGLGWNQRFPRGTGAVGLAVQQGQPVLTTGIVGDPRITLTADMRAGIEHGRDLAVLAVPLAVEDRIVGALGIVAEAGRLFTEEETRLVQAFASQAALALDNAQLLHESRTRQSRLETLVEVSRQLSGIQPLESLLDSIAQACGRLLGSESVGFRLLDGDDLVVMGAAGDARQVMSAPRLKRGESLSGRVAETGQPVIVPRVDDDPRVLPQHQEALRRHGYRAWLGVPVKVGDRLIGVLSIRSRQERGFSEAHVGIATAFASQAAVAIENSRLYEESERRRRGAEALLDNAQALASTFEVGKILASVARRTAQALGAERGLIFLRERQQLVPLMYQVADEHDDSEQWARFQDLPPCRIDEIPAYVEAARIRRPVAIADAQATTAIPRRWVETLGIRSLLVVPILSQDRLLGMLNVGRTSGPSHWTDEQKDLAMTIANQTALAVENARLFAGQREEAEVSGALLRLAGATERVADLDGMLDTVARITPQLLGHLRCAVFLLEPADGSLVLSTAIGFSDAERPLLAGLQGTARIPAMAEAIRSQEPVAVEDAREDTWIPADVARALDIASMLIIPLVSGGRLMGTMAVDTPAGRTTFSDKQITLARSIAAHAAGAIERAWLHAETERRHREAERSEQALRASETRYRLVARATNDAIWDWDLLTNQITWNEGVHTLFGYTPEAASGDADWWIGRLHPDDRDRVVGSVRAAIDSGSQTWFEEFQFRRADGSWAVVADRAYVVYENGRAVRMLGAIADMTDRRQAAEALRRSEEHVRQMQKMEAIGRLAGGIAHDFNNLLTVITGRSELLLRRLREADPVRQDIGLIQKTAERAGSLTRQLLAFSRKQVLQPRVVDANAIVEGLAPMLQRLLGEDIELTIRPAAGARVKADAGQLEQVIVNLAVNARDAMPGGGRLVIAIRCVELDETAARQHGGLPGPHVELAVSDSGVGMDTESQTRIFEPFFTTKAAGHGTGLGLATVYGIVQQHQGAIAVESAPGLGTTFRIYLPATSEPAEMVTSGSGGLPSGSETVLVAEDEDEVRALARDILLQAGYTVLEATNGREAIEHGRSYPHTIHLLLSDVIMPQMSGQELAQRLREVRPQIKVLYMSGYTADALGPRALLAADRVLVQKPFTPDSLARRVRQALDAVPS